VKRTILLFSMVLSFTMTVHAAEIAKYAGEFMATGVGARALGMGGAYVANSSDVTNGYWNPAGLSTLPYAEISAMHSERFSGIVNYDYLAFAMPFRKTETLAISAIRLGVDDIPITDIPRPDLAQDVSYVDDNGDLQVNRPYIKKRVSDAEYAFYLSYANQTHEKFSYGVNAKVVHKGVGDNSAWGIGFDVGVLWNPWNKLQVGANFQDATTTLLAWDTGTQELISPTLKTGVAYPFSFAFAKSRLIVAADIDTRFEGREGDTAQTSTGDISYDLRLGCEYQIYDKIALRVGRDDLGFMTAGAGFILPRLNVDYAFMNHKELAETHRVSISVRLEEKMFARK